jgi:hypothetical protein
MAAWSCKNRIDGGTDFDALSPNGDAIMDGDHTGYFTRETVQSTPAEAD